MNQIGLLGVVAAAVESLRPTLVPRTTAHQALVTAGCTATLALVTQPTRSVQMPGARWLLPVAAAVAAQRAVTHVRAQRRSYPEWTPRPQNPLVAVGVGLAVGIAAGNAPRAAIAGWRRVGTAIADRRGGPAWLWGTAATAAAAGLAGVAVTAGARHGLQVLRSIGTRPDPALRQAPDNDYVSGGPRSVIDYATLARDGRRFVSLRTPAEQIRSVQPEAMEPIRVYSGLHSADTVAERVDLAMADLERLGAFERSNILIMCPSGSGYADYVAAEAIEIYTAGDCASVVIQYGVLPSMLSLDRVAIGAHSVRLLLDRLDARLREMSEPPRVWMYGESLGARVAQDALQTEPARVDAQGRLDGVTALVSVGTPGGPSLRNQLQDSPGVVHLDRWQQMNGDEQAQLWFIDHDADPVTRWDGRLAVKFPRWLHKPRGRNIPDDMNWVPALTWWQVIFDLAFAAQQQSGVFRSIGHDYRADLAPILARVIGSDADVGKTAHLLAEREVMRDRITSATQ